MGNSSITSWKFIKAEEWAGLDRAPTHEQMSDEHSWGIHQITQWEFIKAEEWAGLDRAP